MEREPVAPSLTIELCLLAGKIILQNGGETYRAEDTMIRLAAACGYPEAHSFVTPTVIIFTLDEAEPTARMFRVLDRSTDLRKIATVNRISRAMAEGAIAAEDAKAQLLEADLARPLYAAWLQIVAAAIVSGAFLIMFGGSWFSFAPALLAGGAGYACFLLFQRLVRIKFFSEFLAAIVLGSVATVLAAFGIGDDLGKIIIGAVMPLVPGVLITNAVRDLMAGHLQSGVIKGVEAFLTASAIGAGIALVLSFY